MGYRVRPGLQKTKLFKEQTITTVTRKLEKACGTCVYSGGQLATMSGAGLRNTASITGIGPCHGHHEAQSLGGIVHLLGLNEFWSGCPKAPDRERREVRKRQILLGNGVYLY